MNIINMVLAFLAETAYLKDHAFFWSKKKKNHAFREKNILMYIDVLFPYTFFYSFGVHDMQCFDDNM